MEIAHTLEKTKSLVEEDLSMDIANILNQKLLVLDSLNDLSSVNVFSDYKKLLYPEEWLKTIQIKEKIWCYNLILQFKNPEISKNWLISKWHFQITLFEWRNRIWFLNARLMPQSWKIKFSGMKKIDRSKNGIGNILIQKYLEIAKDFRAKWESIDYSQTTSQTKIDVAYYLKNNWYNSNTSSPRNKFSVYKDWQWNFCIYTTSQNKVKWYNSEKYHYLNSKPEKDDSTYSYLWDVFIWSTVCYKYNKY